MGENTPSLCKRKKRFFLIHVFRKKGGLKIFQSILGSWYESLEDPRESQKRVLLELAKEYEKTQYGRKNHASEVKGVEDYRENFPILDYKTLSPYLVKIQEGNHSAILPEPLACWVMTRGSTGPAKVLPTTKTHLEQIFICGARTLANYVMRKNDLEILTGNILNLNFPSNVHKMVEDGATATYGYSSGTYAKLNPMFNEVSLIPRQEEVDALDPGITKRDWERRFELIYHYLIELSTGSNLTTEFSS